MQAAADVPDEGVREADKAQAQFAPLHDQPGEDEERYGEKDEVAGVADHALGQGE